MDFDTVIEHLREELHYVNALIATAEALTALRGAGAKSARLNARQIGQRNRRAKEQAAVQMVTAGLTGMGARVVEAERKTQ
jgi:hypothetical protein